MLFAVEVDIFRRISMVPFANSLFSNQPRGPVMNIFWELSIIVEYFSIVFGPMSKTLWVSCMADISKSARFHPLQRRNQLAIRFYQDNLPIISERR